MAKSIKDLTPSVIIHPGEILGDELKARGIKQKDFAEIIGVTGTWLNLLIHGSRIMNTRIAYLVATGLGMDVKLWLNLQRNYEVDCLKKDKSFQKRLKRAGVRKWVLETK